MSPPSLSSYVELFFINSTDMTERNQIEVFGFVEYTLSRLIYLKNLLPSSYVPYIANRSTLKLTSTSYASQVIRNTTYFLIKVGVTCESSDRLYQLYTQSGGGVENRYKLVMPSRGLIFR
jgi:hypothetical protein